MPRRSGCALGPSWRLTCWWRPRACDETSGSSKIQEGEELRARKNGTLRKIYLEDDRIVGFRLTGDVRSAGIYRSLMNRGEDVSAFKDRLLAPGFGMGHVETLVSSLQFGL